MARTVSIGAQDDRAGVREWYDGFEFGGVSDIYNPWSITNYLDERILAPYWANSSGNGLVNALLADGLEEMNAYMNNVAPEPFSTFDSGA